MRRSVSTLADYCLVFSVAAAFMSNAPRAVAAEKGIDERELRIRPRDGDGRVA